MNFYFYYAILSLFRFVAVVILVVVRVSDGGIGRAARILASSGTRCMYDFRCAKIQSILRCTLTTVTHIRAERAYERMNHFDDYRMKSSDEKIHCGGK